MEQHSNIQMIEYSDNEMEIDVREIIFLIWKHLLLIIEAGLCVGAVVFLFCTFCLQKTYVSTTEVYILHQQANRETVTASDLQTGTYLTNDYRELITSLPVLENVIAQLDLQMTPSQLENKISVNSPKDTRLIQISVEDTEPYQARLIADTLRVSASAMILQVMDIDSVKVVQDANYPDMKSGPARMKMTCIGCLIGILVMVFFLIVQHLLDDTIKDADDIETALGLFVLGSIPEMKKESRRKRQERLDGSH